VRWNMLVFSLFMTALLSFTMIGFGLVFIKHPPKDINAVYGYRTRMSSINEDTWSFAHHYSGVFWKRSGTIMLLLSLPVIILMRDFPHYEDYMLILFYFQMAALLAVIPVTEKALKRTFDKEGKRKEEGAIN